MQHAVDESDTGVTVFVREGSYEQRLSFDRSGEPGSPISVVAEPGEQTVLDGWLGVAGSVDWGDAPLDCPAN